MGTSLRSATISERYLRKNARERLLGRMKHTFPISPAAYQCSATCLKKAFMMQIYLKLVPNRKYKQNFFIISIYLLLIRWKMDIFTN